MAIKYILPTRCDIRVTITSADETADLTLWKGFLQENDSQFGSFFLDRKSKSVLEMELANKWNTNDVIGRWKKTDLRMKDG